MKENIDYDFSQTNFIYKALFRVGKITQTKLRKKKGKRHGISYNKHWLKVNVWRGISKSAKASIQLIAENLTKGLLFVSIIEKHLKVMETMVRKTLSWYEIVILHILIIYKKSFNKNIVKE